MNRIKYTLGAMVLTVSPFIFAASAYAHTDAINPTHVHGATAEELSQLTTYTTMLKTGGGEYLVYGPPINTDTSLLKTTAIARKALMEQIAVKDPSAFLRAALSSTERSRLPADVKAYVEIESTIQGKITVVHRDDFENPQNATFEHYLHVGSATYRLTTSAEVPIDRSGATVTTSVYTIGTTAVVKEGSTNFVVNVEAPPLDSLGEQKTLVMLVDYLDSPERYISREQVVANFNGGNIDSFIREESYGKTWVNADVYGWYRLPRNFGGVSAYDDGSLFQLIKDNNIPLANYKRIVIIDPGPGNSWSTIGLGGRTIDGVAYQFSVSRVRVDERTPTPAAPNELSGFQNVVIHEYTHALGLQHANGLFCRDASRADVRMFEGTCSHNDYGSRVEVMGGSVISYSANAYYRYKLGWMNPAWNTISVIDSSGSFVINAIEGGGEEAKPLGAIIIDPVLGTPLYSVELRKAAGFDAKIASVSPEDTQGLLIHRIVQLKVNGHTFTYVLDLNPNGDKYTVIPYALKVGSPPFVDPTTGVSVTADVIGSVYAAGDDAARFTVTMAPTSCVRRPPLVLSSPPYYFYEAGTTLDAVASSTVSYRPRFLSENGYACPNATYEMAATLPQGWSMTAQPKVVVSKKMFDFLAVVTVPRNALPGKYHIPYTMRDREGVWTFTDAFDVKVSPPPPVHGDVNGDYVINTTDALFALRIAVGQDVLGASTVRVDVNCDGAKTASDALLILRKAVGQDVTFCTPTSIANLTFTKEGSGLISPALSGTATTPIVSLTATPAQDQTFIGWTGACTGTGICTVSLPDTANLSLKATFSPTAELHSGGDTGTIDDGGTATPPPTTKADLALFGGRDLRVAPARVFAQKAISVIAKYKNQGTESTFLGGRISLRIDKDNNNSWDFATAESYIVLKPNQVKSTKFKKLYTPPTQGSYRYQVCVNDNAIAIDQVLTTNIPEYKAGTNDGPSHNNCMTNTFTAEPARQTSTAAAVGGALMLGSLALSIIVLARSRSRVLTML